MAHDDMYSAIERSEKEVDHVMEPFLDQNNLENNDQDTQYTIENACRICYDEDKNEITISPCNCVGSHAHVHVSCLEHWLSVSKSSSCDICNYSFKTVERSLTVFEWLRGKRNYGGCCQQFSAMSFFLTIWLFVLILCGLKTVDFLLDKKDQNAFSAGLLMFIITVGMAGMMWFWILIFSSLWRRMNMVIRLDKNAILNGPGDITTTFAV